MRFTFADLLWLLVIVAILIILFLPILKEPKSDSDVVELRLPADFHEMVSVSYSHGHVYLTYKNNNNGHRTYSYGYFNASPETVNWVESGNNKDILDK